MALIKPLDIGFEWQEARLEEAAEEKQDSYKQLSFTHAEIDRIEKIPYDFITPLNVRRLIALDTEC